jgi:hypothetical protein
MPELYDRVRTLVDLETLHHGRLDAGREGHIVDVFNAPGEYAIDIEIPAPELVGGLTYENVALGPDQFVVIERDGLPGEADSRDGVHRADHAAG